MHHGLTFRAQYLEFGAMTSRDLASSPDGKLGKKKIASPRSKVAQEKASPLQRGKVSGAPRFPEPAGAAKFTKNSSPPRKKVQIRSRTVEEKSKGGGGVKDDDENKINNAGDDSEGHPTIPKVVDPSPTIPPPKEKRKASTNTGITIHDEEWKRKKRRERLFMAIAAANRIASNFRARKGRREYGRKLDLAKRLQVAWRLKKSREALRAALYALLAADWVRKEGIPGSSDGTAASATPAASATTGPTAVSRVRTELATSRAEESDTDDDLNQDSEKTENAARKKFRRRSVDFLQPNKSNFLGPSGKFTLANSPISLSSPLSAFKRSRRGGVQFSSQSINKSDQEALNSQKAFLQSSYQSLLQNHGILRTIRLKQLVLTLQGNIAFCVGVCRWVHRRMRLKAGEVMEVMGDSRVMSRKRLLMGGGWLQLIERLQEAERIRREIEEGEKKKQDAKENEERRKEREKENTPQDKRDLVFRGMGRKTLISLQGEHGLSPQGSGQGSENEKEGEKEEDVGKAQLSETEKLAQKERAVQLQEKQLEVLNRENRELREKFKRLNEMGSSPGKSSSPGAKSKGRSPVIKSDKQFGSSDSDSDDDDNHDSSSGDKTKVTKPRPDGKREMIEIPTGTGLSPEDIGIDLGISFDEARSHFRLRAARAIQRSWNNNKYKFAITSFVQAAKKIQRNWRKIKELRNFERKHEMSIRRCAKLVCPVGVSLLSLAQWSIPLGFQMQVSDASEGCRTTDESEFSEEEEEEQGFSEDDDFSDDQSDLNNFPNSNAEFSSSEESSGSSSGFGSSAGDVVEKGGKRKRKEGSHNAENENSNSLSVDEAKPKGDQAITAPTSPISDPASPTSAEKTTGKRKRVKKKKLGNPKVPSDSEDLASPTSPTSPTSPQLHTEDGDGGAAATDTMIKKISTGGKGKKKKTEGLQGASSGEKDKKSLVKKKTSGNRKKKDLSQNVDGSANLDTEFLEDPEGPEFDLADPDQMNDGLRFESGFGGFGDEGMFGRALSSPLLGEIIMEEDDEEEEESDAMVEEDDIIIKKIGEEIPLKPAEKSIESMDSSDESFPSESPASSQDTTPVVSRGLSSASPVPPSGTSPSNQRIRRGSILKTSKSTIGSEEVPAIVSTVNWGGETNETEKANPEEKTSSFETDKKAKFEAMRARRASFQFGAGEGPTQNNGSSGSGMSGLFQRQGTLPIAEADEGSKSDDSSTSSSSSTSSNNSDDSEVDKRWTDQLTGDERRRSFGQTGRSKTDTQYVISRTRSSGKSEAAELESGDTFQIGGSDDLATAKQATSSVSGMKSFRRRSILKTSVFEGSSSENQNSGRSSVGVTVTSPNRGRRTTFANVLEETSFGGDDDKLKSSSLNGVAEGDSDSKFSDKKSKSSTLGVDSGDMTASMRLRMLSPIGEDYNNKEEDSEDKSEEKADENKRDDSNIDDSGGPDSTKPVGKTRSVKRRKSIKRRNTLIKQKTFEEMVADANEDGGSLGGLPLSFEKSVSRRTTIGGARKGKLRRKKTRELMRGEYGEDDDDASWRDLDSKSREGSRRGSQESEGGDNRNRGGSKESAGGASKESGSSKEKSGSPRKKKGGNRGKRGSKDTQRRQTQGSAGSGGGFARTSKFLASGKSGTFDDIDSPAESSEDSFEDISDADEVLMRKTVRLQNPPRFATERRAIEKEKSLTSPRSNASSPASPGSPANSDRFSTNTSVSHNPTLTGLAKFRSRKSAVGATGEVFGLEKLGVPRCWEKNKSEAGSPNKADTTRVSTLNQWSTPSDSQMSMFQMMQSPRSLRKHDAAEREKKLDLSLARRNFEEKLRQNRGAPALTFPEYVYDREERWGTVRMCYPQKDDFISQATFSPTSGGTTKKPSSAGNKQLAMGKSDNVNSESKNKDRNTIGSANSTFLRCGTGLVREEQLRWERGKYTTLNFRREPNKTIEISKMVTTKAKSSAFRRTVIGRLRTSRNSRKSMFGVSKFSTMRVAGSTFSRMTVSGGYSRGGRLSARMSMFKKKSSTSSRNRDSENDTQYIDYIDRTASSNKLKERKAARQRRNTERRMTIRKTVQEGGRDNENTEGSDNRESGATMGITEITKTKSTRVTKTIMRNQKHSGRRKRSADNLRAAERNGRKGSTDRTGEKEDNTDDNSSEKVESSNHTESILPQKSAQDCEAELSKLRSNRKDFAEKGSFRNSSNLAGSETSLKSTITSMLSTSNSPLRRRSLLGNNGPTSSIGLARSRQSGLNQSNQSEFSSSQSPDPHSPISPELRRSSNLWGQKATLSKMRTLGVMKTVKTPLFNSRINRMAIVKAPSWRGGNKVDNENATNKDDNEPPEGNSSISSSPQDGVTRRNSFNRGQLGFRKTMTIGAGNRLGGLGGLQGTLQGAATAFTGRKSLVGGPGTLTGAYPVSHAMSSGMSNNMAGGPLASGGPGFQNNLNCNNPRPQANRRTTMTQHQLLGGLQANTNSYGGMGGQGGMGAVGPNARRNQILPGLQAGAMMGGVGGMIPMGGGIVNAPFNPLMNPTQQRHLVQQQRLMQENYFRIANGIQPPIPNSQLAEPEDAPMDLNSDWGRMKAVLLMSNEYRGVAHMELRHGVMRFERPTIDRKKRNDKEEDKNAGVCRSKTEGGVSKAADIKGKHQKHGKHGSNGGSAGNGAGSGQAGVTKSKTAVGNANVAKSVTTNPNECESKNGIAEETGGSTDASTDPKTQQAALVTNTYTPFHAGLFVRLALKVHSQNQPNRNNSNLNNNAPISHTTTGRGQVGPSGMNTLNGGANTAPGMHQRRGGGNMNSSVYAGGRRGSNNFLLKSTGNPNISLRNSANGMSSANNMTLGGINTIAPVDDVNTLGQQFGNLTNPFSNNNVADQVESLKSLDPFRRKTQVGKNQLRNSSRKSMMVPGMNQMEGGANVSNSGNNSMNDPSTALGICLDQAQGNSSPGSPMPFGKRQSIRPSQMSSLSPGPGSSGVRNSSRKTAMISPSVTGGSTGNSTGNITGNHNISVTKTATMRKSDVRRTVEVAANGSDAGSDGSRSPGFSGSPTMNNRTSMSSNSPPRGSSRLAVSATRTLGGPGNSASNSARNSSRLTVAQASDQNSCPTGSSRLGGFGAGNTIINGNTNRMTASSRLTGFNRLAQPTASRRMGKFRNSDVSEAGLEEEDGGKNDDFHKDDDGENTNSSNAPVPCRMTISVQGETDSSEGKAPTLLADTSADKNEKGKADTITVASASTSAGNADSASRIASSASPASMANAIRQAGAKKRGTLFRSGSGLGERGEDAGTGKDSDSSRPRGKSVFQRGNSLFFGDESTDNSNRRGSLTSGRRGSTSGNSNSPPGRRGSLTGSFGNATNRRGSSGGIYPGGGKNANNTDANTGNNNVNNNNFPVGNANPSSRNAGTRNNGKSGRNRRGSALGMGGSSSSGMGGNSSRNHNHNGKNGRNSTGNDGGKYANSLENAIKEHSKKTKKELELEKYANQLAESQSKIREAASVADFLAKGDHNVPIHCFGFDVLDRDCFLSF